MLHNSEIHICTCYYRVMVWLHWKCNWAWVRLHWNCTSTSMISTLKRTIIYWVCMSTITHIRGYFQSSWVPGLDNHATMLMCIFLWFYFIYFVSIDYFYALLSQLSCAWLFVRIAESHKKDVDQGCATFLWVYVYFCEYNRRCIYFGVR